MMGDNSKIEWTDATWNPIRARNLKTGKLGHFCVKVNAACANCYAERLQPRFGNDARYAAQDQAKVEIFLDEDVLTQPYRWKRPRMIFVCSMTDICGEFVPDLMVHLTLDVMEAAKQHTYQVLTKRPKRLREIIESRLKERRRYADAFKNCPTEAMRNSPAAKDARKHAEAGPPANIWVGTSVHDQPSADAFIPDLLATPAAVRFVSYEPALGPVDFTDISWPKGRPTFPETDDVSDSRSALHLVEGTKLDWIIAGGESGPGARPAHPGWFRAARDQCKAAGVPFLFKQHGEWVPLHALKSSGPEVVIDASGRDVTGLISRQDHCCARMFRVGKKRAGRLLDGVTHDGFPEVPRV